MLHRRCLVPIAVSLCLAAPGCRYQTRVSATSMTDSKTPSARPATSAEASRTGGTVPLHDNAGQIVNRTPDGRAISITFDDLQLEMKEDSVFDPSMLTARVKQLDGQRVRIRGFIYPAVLQQTGITKFPLIKNTQCKFGPGGLAHHIILVDLRPGLSTSFTVRPIAVEGLLTVRPFDGPDGKTWTIYHMVGDKVD